MPKLRLRCLDDKKSKLATGKVVTILSRRPRVEPDLQRRLAIAGPFGFHPKNWPPSHMGLGIIFPRILARVTVVIHNSPSAAAFWRTSTGLEPEEVATVFQRMARKAKHTVKRYSLVISLRTFFSCISSNVHISRSMDFVALQTRERSSRTSSKNLESSIPTSLICRCLGQD